MEGGMHGTMETMERRSAKTGSHTIFPTMARGTPHEALDQLEQFGTTVTMPHDGEIVGQGDAAEFCYRILNGCVRRVTLLEDGRRQVGEFLLAGDLFGFDALATHDFAAEAVSDVVLRRYPRRMVEALAERNARFARQLRDLAAEN